MNVYIQKLTASGQKLLPKLKIIKYLSNMANDLEERARDLEIKTPNTFFTGKMIILWVEVFIISVLIT